MSRDRLPVDAVLLRFAAVGIVRLARPRGRVRSARGASVRWPPQTTIRNSLFNIQHSAFSIQHLSLMGRRGKEMPSNIEELVADLIGGQRVEQHHNPAYKFMGSAPRRDDDANVITTGFKILAM